MRWLRSSARWACVRPFPPHRVCRRSRSVNRVGQRERTVGGAGGVLDMGWACSRREAANFQLRSSLHGPPARVEYGSARSAMFFCFVFQATAIGNAKKATAPSTRAEKGLKDSQSPCDQKLDRPSIGHVNYALLFTGWAFLFHGLDRRPCRQRVYSSQRLYYHFTCRCALPPLASAPPPMIPPRSTPSLSLSVSLFFLCP